MKPIAFTISRIERDGRHTPIFKRFPDDIKDQGAPMIGVQYLGAGNAMLVVSGSEVKSLLHTGEALVFKLEEVG